MPLSLFNYKTLSHYVEAPGKSDRFEHSFGGDPSSFDIRFVNFEPLHLCYRLNLADPALDVELPGVRWLPLVYHFSYASYEGELIYRVFNDVEIELILPEQAAFDPDFPYPSFPREFPLSPVKFTKQPYDPAIAEQALSLAKIFGLERLSESEMKRAVAIVENTTELIRNWQEMDPRLSPEEIVRMAYEAPFGQGAPSKKCDNPECTAEIAHRSEALMIPADPDDPDDHEIHLEARDVRVDSMRVIALYTPSPNETRMWGNAGVQLVFEICDVCQCIRVSNQCD